jgi:hypothetical protein
MCNPTRTPSRICDFTVLEELHAMRDQLETWSQICVDHLWQPKKNRTLICLGRNACLFVQRVFSSRTMQESSLSAAASPVASLNEPTMPGSSAAEDRILVERRRGATHAPSTTSCASTLPKLYGLDL